MTWDDIVTVFQFVLTLCGAASCIAGGVVAISKLFKPHADLKRQVNAHSAKFVEVDATHKEIKDALVVVEDTQKMLCLSMLDLLDHQISGNHVDRMIKTRDRMNEFIVAQQFDHI